MVLLQLALGGGSVEERGGKVHIGGGSSTDNAGGSAVFESGCRSDSSIFASLTLRRYLCALQNSWSC